MSSHWPFNRTLWNWNYSSPPHLLRSLPFNRTLWNWNILVASSWYRNTAFNRTLWNWNCRSQWYVLPGICLLIVPYGIETCLTDFPVFFRITFNRTLWNWNLICNLCTVLFIRLLIVPYGIETREYKWHCRHSRLLIVPYGIETTTRRNDRRGGICF